MSKKTIAIFCGHGVSRDGTWDSGCVYNGYTEATLMEKITRSAVYYLRQCNVKIITDVPGNRINMYAQVDAANAGGADLFVSVHCDYYKATEGTLPLYLSESGRRAAKAMNKYVLRYSSVKTRGLGFKRGLYELGATQMPAVIFECGSIKADRKNFEREYDAIGFGIARGICEFFDVEFSAIQFKLLQKLAGIELQVLRNLKYSGKATNATYKQALGGNKLMNCALVVSWALQRAHVLEYGQRIWLGEKVNGPAAAALREKCKVMHPKKKWYNCGLHIGDIVGFQWGSASANKVHTMVLIGYDKGRPVWATFGGSDVAAKDCSRKRAYYERKNIMTICRINPDKL